MSNQDGTTTEVRATVPQILADLLLLHAAHQLPDPVGIHATGNSIVGIDLTSVDAFQAWCRALGAGDPLSQPFREGHLHVAYARGRRGWSVSVTAITAPESHTAPDAETLEQLRAVAA